ncbi:penicillin-binding protein 2 [Candidatus Aminicenantes bacterium AC-334-K16]|nr:penicillin-binding protein 2 [Candidatus Aminicenantes bacterium AC-334-K16]
MARIYEDLTPLYRRIRVIQRLIIALVILMCVFIWKMQILDYNRYWQKAENNRLREIKLTPQRGLIVDRNGVILAKNRASFKVSFIRENVTDMNLSLERVARLLSMKKEELAARLAKYNSLPDFVPIVIKDELSVEEVARIESHQMEFPELRLAMEPQRDYPFGPFASHVLGYLQEISLAELRHRKNQGHEVGDMIGKTGIEFQYEEELAGRKGLVVEVVDSLGRKVKELVQRPPTRGNKVYLSLDYDLQAKAEELLKGREGAIVVLDPRSGDILALASFPNYDPNKFIHRFSPQEWVSFVQDPRHPLENRAIRGLYAPGSIFKLVMALAGLDSGLVSPWTTFFCSGTTIIYGHPFSCWYEPGHGAVNLVSAIQHSCNIYFYNLGKLLGIERIAAYARQFGLGKLTGIDLPGEKTGLVPDPEWKRRSRGAPWYPGETISVSIGQGPILVTPLQVAVLTGMIALRGKRVTPHLFLQVERRKELVKYSPAQPAGEGSWSGKQTIFDRVITGMWKSVNAGGTGQGARLEGYDICGKTGSTQVVSQDTADKLKRKIKTHSWFTGFASRDNPRVVVTVIVEFGGMGGQTAAPIARQLFELYRRKYD